MLRAHLNRLAVFAALVVAFSTTAPFYGDYSGARQMVHESSASAAAGSCHQPTKAAQFTLESEHQSVSKQASSHQFECGLCVLALFVGGMVLPHGFGFEAVAVQAGLKLSKHAQSAVLSVWPRFFFVRGPPLINS